MWSKLNLRSKSKIDLKADSNDETVYKAYLWLFDFKKLGCVNLPVPGVDYSHTRLQKLEVHDIKSIRKGRFSLRFLTDSVGTSFTFVKAVPPPPPVDPSLANDDQAEAFKKLGYDPAFDSIGFVDPGRTDLFTLLYPTLTKLSPKPSSVKSYSLTKHYEGLELKSKKPARIISMSNKEFYHLASRTQCNKIRARYLADHDRPLQPEAKLQHINSTCPSPKASNFFDFLRFVDHKLKHLTTFTNHYDRRYRVLKMRTYRGNMFIY